MKYTITLFFVCFAICLNAQNTFWTLIEEEKMALDRNSEKNLLPSQYQTLSLDIAPFEQLMQSAPKEFSKQKGLIMELPLPNGKMETFEIWESSIMEEGLAKRYPNIKTYKGKSTNNPLIISRFGFSKLGFHAMIQTPKGVALIDPYAKEQKKYYTLSYAKDSPVPADWTHRQRSCGMPAIAPHIKENQLEIFKKNQPAQSRNANEAVDLYIYKAAIACSGEYANYHGETTKEGVLSHIVAVLNRTNMVFERDLALRMELIAETDSILFLDPNTDPYSDGSNVVQSYQENPAAIEKIINPSKFDIGHVFIASCGSGVVGIGGGNTCDATKSLGISCQFSTDARFAIDIVAHEMGHQLYASHSWNNCPGNEDNFSGGTAYEPGSGSTIMSYAGACGPSNNIQTFAHDYYHVANLQQILNDKLLGRTNGCADIIPTSNIKPKAIINYEPGFYIPISTPFELVGDGFDANGDQLTYCWEQYNSGPSVDLGSPVGTTPLFRSFPPSTSPLRSFPRKEDIINNITRNQEVLPNYARNLNFRLTVRDNHAEAGGVDWENLSFEVTDQAGPFKVAFPNLATDEVTVGDFISVEWEVANTNGNLVNCQKVNILLSTDGGNTFPITLVANTDNDGSQMLTIPDQITNQARIRVEAADNIFFDISNQNFAIIPPTEAGFSFSPAFQEQQVCLPNKVEIPLTTIALLDFSNEITFSIENISNGNDAFEVQFSKASTQPGTSNQLTLDFPADYPRGIVSFDIVGNAEGRAPISRSVQLDLVSNLFTNFQLAAPANNSSGIGLPTFEWVKTRDANAYEIEIANNPTFTGASLETATITDGTTYIPQNALIESTIYYWRVRPLNDCGAGSYSEIFAFQTENLSCTSIAGTEVPIIISSQGKPTIQSKLTITENFTISDLNLPKIKGRHDWVSHIRTTLISPAGTEAILFSGKCPGSVPFDLGFDDESPNAIACPPIGGSLHQPQEALSIFDGENTFGEWTLQIEVIDGFGEGGSLDEWSIEFCGNISLNPPVLVNNEVLAVKPQSGRLINTEFLLTEDANNNADELVYTLVASPQIGSLLFNKEAIEVGAIFNQNDINTGLLKYRHDALEQNGTDAFKFTVSDQEGGWIGITTFQINIDSSATTVGINDVLAADEIHLFPNPTTEKVFIEIKNKDLTPINISLYDLNARQIHTQALNHSIINTINVQNLENGIYFIKIQFEEGLITKKLIIQE
jgi:subtilisin-like proprotein convertase family protein